MNKLRKTGKNALSGRLSQILLKVSTTKDGLNRKTRPDSIDRIWLDRIRGKIVRNKYAVPKAPTVMNTLR